jgi:hypothetical protein
VELDYGLHIAPAATAPVSVLGSRCHGSRPISSTSSGNVRRTGPYVATGRLAKDLRARSAVLRRAVRGHIAYRIGQVNAERTPYMVAPEHSFALRAPGVHRGGGG